MEGLNFLHTSSIFDIRTVDCIWIIIIIIVFRESIKLIGGQTAPGVWETIGFNPKNLRTCPIP